MKESEKTIGRNVEINQKLLALAMKEANLTKDEVLLLLDNPEWDSVDDRRVFESRWKLKIGCDLAEIWDDLWIDSRLVAFYITVAACGNEF